MKKTTNFLDTLLNNWWLRHSLFWIALVCYFTWGWGYKELTWPQRLFCATLLVTISAGVVYPVFYILIPNYLFKKKFIHFFIGFAALIAMACGISYLIIELPPLGPTDLLRPFRGAPGKFISPYIKVTCMAASIKLIKYYFFQERNALRAEAEKSQAELELLKSQIHPHFLFNTLNNLFAHTLQNSPDSPTIVSKLTDLLKFMVYESKAESIPLQQEINLLKNYINLEQLRYGKDLNLTYSFEGDIHGKRIAPLLLLPLVENSFKHGVSQQVGEKWITIQARAEKNQLHFKIANSYDPDQKPHNVPGKKQGIGLENVKRRLELIYPGKHQIHIEKKQHSFEVSVELELSADKPLATDIYQKHVPTYHLEMPAGG